MKERVKSVIAGVGDAVKRAWQWVRRPRLSSEGGMEGDRGMKIAGVILLVLLLLFFGLGWYWSREPKSFDVVQVARNQLTTRDVDLVTGTVTTGALIHVAETLLTKPGGYLSNDVTPPSLFLDNMPNWEFGALVQVRDLARSMRNDMSRSRSQSVESPFLAKAEPLFNFENDSWIFPDSQDQYRKGIRVLREYQQLLSSQTHQEAQFYARADNLNDWLSVVSKRLGSLSQRLTACVGEARVNTDLAGDSAAQQSTPVPDVVVVKTPWLDIDDVFFEARGTTWALYHFLCAVQVDFEAVLKKKNAQALIAQVIRELEGTQHPIRSPLILNGRGFGVLANHSLVMASYVSKANAAIIDLRNLLSDG